MDREAMSGTALCWEGFRTFFKIGLFTFGGGYAMIPLIQKEVVERHQWMTAEELLDVIAVAQSCPGVFAINVSTTVGYRLKGKRGAFCAALGTALPSFVIILLIAMFFRRYAENGVVAALFRGLRPAVVALIAVPALNMARGAKIGWGNCWIPVVCALAIWAFGVSPIVIILAAAVGGWLYGRATDRRKGGGK